MQSSENLKKQVMIPIIYSVVLFSSFIIYYKYAGTFLSETLNSFSGKVGSTLDGNGDLKVIEFSYVCLVIYSVLSVLHVSWKSLVLLKHASYTTYISDIKYITLYFGLSLAFVNLFKNYNEYSKLNAVNARIFDKIKIKHGSSMKTNSGPDRETQSLHAGMAISEINIISPKNMELYQRNSYLQCLLSVVLLSGFSVIYTTCYFMQREKYKEEDEEDEGEEEEEKECIIKDLEKEGFMYSDSDSDCED